MSGHRNYKKVEINISAFERAMGAHGIDPYQISLEMGFSKKYLWNKARLGYLGLNDATYLDRVCGVSVTEYDLEHNPLDAEESVPVEESSKVVEIDYDRLYDTIFKAVFKAVKLAWEDGDLPEE